MGEDGLLHWRSFNHGRLRKTTAEQDRAIVDEIVRNPFGNASDVIANSNVQVCANTVRNRV